MTRSLSILFLIVSCFVAADVVPSQQNQNVGTSKLSKVMLSAVDSFGGKRDSCQVSQFKRLDFPRGGDYSHRFSGLSGTDIPYGFKYEVYIRCDDKSVSGPFFMTVSRENKFEVLASWLNVGDYVTGPDPRLTVVVHSKQGSRLEGTLWIKVVGVFVNKIEVDRIDPQLQSAKFYEIVPGRYLLLLLSGGKVMCTQQIDFLDAPARLELSLSGESCSVERMSSMRIL